ncbi:hypothetical protein DIPPA_30162 [Diplonema papillatum]|nr:hypothetical protein DIPPA_30162 [Diplonema papillatum]
MPPKKAAGKKASPPPSPAKSAQRPAAKRSAPPKPSPSPPASSRRPPGKKASPGPAATPASAGSFRGPKPSPRSPKLSPKASPKLSPKTAKSAPGGSLPVLVWTESRPKEQAVSVSLDASVPFYAQLAAFGNATGLDSRCMLLRRDGPFGECVAETATPAQAGVRSGQLLFASADPGATVYLCADGGPFRGDAGLLLPRDTPFSALLPEVSHLFPHLAAIPDGPVLVWGHGSPPHVFPQYDRAVPLRKTPRDLDLPSRANDPLLVFAVSPRKAAPVETRARSVPLPSPPAALGRQVHPKGMLAACFGPDGGAARPFDAMSAWRGPPPAAGPRSPPVVFTESDAATPSPGDRQAKALLGLWAARTPERGFRLEEARRVLANLSAEAPAELPGYLRRLGYDVAKDPDALCAAETTPKPAAPDTPQPQQPPGLAGKARSLLAAVARRLVPKPPAEDAPPAPPQDAGELFPWGEGFDPRRSVFEEQYERDPVTALLAAHDAYFPCHAETPPDAALSRRLWATRDRTFTAALRAAEAHSPLRHGNAHDLVAVVVAAALSLAAGMTRRLWWAPSRAELPAGFRVPGTPPDPAVARFHLAAHRREKLLRALLEAEAGRYLAPEARAGLAVLAYPAAADAAGGDAALMLLELHRGLKVLRAHHSFVADLPAELRDRLDRYVAGLLGEEDDETDPLGTHGDPPPALRGRGGGGGGELAVFDRTSSTVALARRNSDVLLVLDADDPRAAGGGEMLAESPVARPSLPPGELPPYAALSAVNEVEAELRFLVDALYSIHGVDTLYRDLRKVDQIAAFVLHAGPGREEARRQVIEAICEKYHVPAAHWLGRHPPPALIKYHLESLRAAYGGVTTDQIDQLTEQLAADVSPKATLRHVIASLCAKLGACVDDWTGPYPPAIRLMHRPL